MLSTFNSHLELGFEVLNRVYFENRLEKPVITIQSSPKAFGYITTQKVWSDTEDSYYEINISAEYLARPLENVFATLQHELCHLYAMQNGIADTSKNGSYHNKKFKEIAENRGLIIEYVQYIGYSKTTPSDEFISVLFDNGLLDFDMKTARTGGVTGGDDNTTTPPPSPTAKKKTSTRKYICPSCGISVRATKDVNIGCLDCGCMMLKDIG